MANDDRIKKSDADNKLPKPEVKIIKDRSSFYKPTMKTFFVDETNQDGEIKQVTFGGTYCSCNSVCTCENVCTCNPVVTCTCLSYKISTAPKVCSTNKPSTCPCVSHRYPSGGGCSCNKVCTCVPVT